MLSLIYGSLGAFQRASGLRSLLLILRDVAFIDSSIHSVRFFLSFLFYYRKISRITQLDWARSRYLNTNLRIWAETSWFEKQFSTLWGILGYRQLCDGRFETA